MRHSGQRNRGRAPRTIATSRPARWHIAVTSAGVRNSSNTCRSFGAFLTNQSTPLITTSCARRVRLNVWKKNRPPGRSTRAASSIKRSGRSTCSIRSIAHTTSKLASA